MTARTNRRASVAFRSAKGRAFAERKPTFGYTLTELLVVVTIVVILVAATLPIAKRVMDDSRTRDSARLVAGNLAMAQTYAARNNRPFGIWLELAPVTAVPDLPGPVPPARSIRQCTRMFLAEVQAPYSGDVLGSSGAYVTIPVLSGPPGPPDFTGPWPLTFVNASMLDSLVGLNEVFRIRFDYRGYQYLGYRDNNTPGNYFLYGLGGVDGAWGVAGTDDDGNSTADDASEYMAGGSDDLQMPIPPHHIQGNPPPPYHPFQILRLPRRVGSPIELVNGTCIDLEYCGMGTTGTEFASASNYIVVMFGPKGEIDGLIGDNVVRGATGTLHFLVGQVDKLNDPIATPSVGSNLYPMTMFDPSASNLSDVNSVWVSIGRASGQVTTTENLVPPVDIQASPPNVIIFPGEAVPPNGRQAVLSPANATHRELYLSHCREVATNRDQMGGK